MRYVASTTLEEPLTRRNATLLKGDAAAAVAGLKEAGKDLLVFGSGELIQSLMHRDLVDEHVLFHPLVLGSGRRLLPDGGVPVTLQLVDAKPAPTGVVVSTYRPAR